MKKNEPSKINFGRSYPFYIKKLGTNRAFAFQVTVVAQKKINQKTGMSVDLQSLDQISSALLNKNRTTKLEIQQTLMALTDQFKNRLKVFGTKLISIRFDECRGSGFLFKGEQVYFIRADYATDKVGELFKVISYFNKKNQLVRTDLENFKLKTDEQLIFSNGQV